MSLEKPQVISLAEFVNDVNSSLDLAVDPEVGLPEAVETARSVKDQLAAVEAGRIAVHPPLSEEQKRIYRERAETVIAVGSKATLAIQEAAQASTQSRGIFSRFRGRRSQSTAHKPSFSGKGSEAKSY